jgi:hypothetical protein
MSYGFTNKTFIGKTIDFKIWEVVQSIVYVTRNGDRIIIPSGFKTDLVTVPRIFWTAVSPIEKYSLCAILHDYMIETKDSSKYSKEYIDLIFKESLESLNVNPATIKILYTSVKYFGIY